MRQRYFACCSRLALLIFCCPPCAIRSAFCLASLLFPQIFGPILPIVVVADVDAAVDEFVQERRKAEAAYAQAKREELMKRLGVGEGDMQQQYAPPSAMQSPCAPFRLKDHTPHVVVFATE